MVSMYAISGRQQNERAPFRYRLSQIILQLCFHSFYCSHLSAAHIAARSTSEVRVNVRMRWDEQGTQGKHRQRNLEQGICTDMVTNYLQYAVTSWEPKGREILVDAPVWPSRAGVPLASTLRHRWIKARLIKFIFLQYYELLGPISFQVNNASGRQVYYDVISTKNIQSLRIKGYLKNYSHSNFY